MACFEQISALQILNGLRPGRIISKPNYWSQEEDQQLLHLMLRHGHKGWKRISAMMPSGKTPDQCCQRWHRVLNPHIKHVDWSVEEDALLTATIPLYPPGNWRRIARHIPGRTGQQCRYRWRHINKGGSVSTGAAATKEGTTTMSSSSSGSTVLQSPAFVSTRQSSFQPIPAHLASAPGHSADELEIACHLSALSSVRADPLQAKSDKETEDKYDVSDNDDVSDDDDNNPPPAPPATPAAAVGNDDEETIDEAEELCQNHSLQPQKVLDTPEAKSVSKMSISWLIS